MLTGKQINKSTYKMKILFAMLVLSVAFLTSLANADDGVPMGVAIQQQEEIEKLRRQQQDHEFDMQRLRTQQYMQDQEHERQLRDLQMQADMQRTQRILEQQKENRVMTMMPVQTETKIDYSNGVFGPFEESTPEPSFLAKHWLPIAIALTFVVIFGFISLSTRHS